MKYLKNTGIYLIGVLVSALLLHSAASASSGAVYINADDTLVGESSFVSAGGFSAGQELDLILDKPDDGSVKFVVFADNKGQFGVTLSARNFTTAGTYYVYVQNIGGDVISPRKSFSVLSTGVSLEKSQVHILNPLVKPDGTDAAVVLVTLNDGYGNPLSGRLLRAYSSRVSDRILNNFVSTDSRGQAKFQIVSNMEGISTVTVLETADDLILANDLKISFSGDTAISDAGGYIFPIANAADSTGILAGFELSDFPDVIKPNTSVSFKLTAVDDAGATVEDYTGKVRFSVDGDNASDVGFPTDYKFLTDDLGVHEFSLGLTFAKPGTYNFVVNDVDDRFKKGEKTLVVGEGTSVVTDDNPNKPILTSPTETTISRNEITVSGTARTSSKVKVYDNAKYLKDLGVGPSGRFSGQITDLADGKHTIYVTNYDEITGKEIGTSDPVDVTVDSTAPTVDDLQLDPAGEVKPGSIIKVKLYSEKNLSKASLDFNFELVDLTASIDDPSVYVGELIAPSDPGEYMIGAVLADALGSEASEKDLATVVVSKEPVVTPPVTEKPVAEEPKTPVGDEKPSTVQHLIAYGSNQRVTLVWDAATDDKMVQKYKIYYGEDVNNLDQSVTTRDASVTWYIPNLKNGTEYFFAVTAIDDAGQESENRSEVLSARPYPSEMDNSLQKKPTSSIDENALKPAAYSGPFPAKSPNSGPEVLLVGVASLAVSALLRNRKNSKKK